MVSTDDRGTVVHPNPQGSQHDTLRAVKATARRGRRTMRGTFLGSFALALVLASSGPAMAQAPTKQPNILVLWGDDIGYWNVSATTRA